MQVAASTREQRRLAHQSVLDVMLTAMDAEDEMGRGKCSRDI